MSSLQGRLQSPDYRNWVKAGLCLIHTKEGLEDFADSASQLLHKNILNNLTKASVPSSGHPVCGITIKRQNLFNTCFHPYCQGFLKEVIQEGVDPNHPFTFRPGNLANTDVGKWHDGPWELAKLFMNPGQLATQTCPSQTDFSGIINFLSHCRVPRNQLTNIVSLDEVRRARNGIMHTSDMKLSAPDLQTYSQSMADLLSDPSISNFPRAKLAAANIKKILTAADFQITLEDESLVIDKLAGELHSMTAEIRDKLADVAEGGAVEREDIRQKQQQIQDEIKKTIRLYETLKKTVDDSSVLQDKMTKSLTTIKELLERVREDLGTDLRNFRKQQNIDTESIASLQRDVANLKAGTQQKNEIPSEKAIADLKQYLIDGYQNKKLNVTLLPKWIDLHVSKIFAPVILVNNKSLGSYKGMFFEESDVSKNCKSGHRVPTVLLGKAGEGKTTLSKHITDAWANPTNTSFQFTDANDLQQFKCVFYVSCRFAKEKDTILDMIENQLFSCKDETMRNVARQVLKHRPELCLILVDGLDEWKGSASSDTGRRDDIQGVPSLYGVEDCVIFITSRPWRFHALSFDTKKKIRQLELSGIKNEKELILDIFKYLKDPEPEELRKNFLFQIREKNMSELLKTPLMLIITLDVWRNEKVLHKSLCTNYLNMITAFICRAEGGWSSADRRINEGVRSDIFGIGGAPSAIKLPGCFSVNKQIQRYSGLLVSLGHLACDLLLGEQEQSLVFPKDVCESYLDDEDDEKLIVCLVLGILSKTETTAHGIEIVESYSFAHKTFQEFLAALWLALKFADEKSKLYQCVITIDNVFDSSVLIQFLCGLFPEAGVDFWRYVSEKVIDKDLEIMKYRYKESLDVWVIRKVEEIQRLILKTMKEARDCCDEQEEQVCYCIPDVLINSGTSNEDVLLLCGMMQSNTDYMKSLVMMIQSFSINEQNHRIGRSVSCATDLQRLELIGMIPSMTRRSGLVLDLQKHNRLQALQLNVLPISGLLLPSQTESQLQYLELWGLELSHDNLVQLCSTLSSLSGLRELNLYNLPCTDHSGSTCLLSLVDLHKSIRLEKLLFGTLPICGLLLPPHEGSQLRDVDLWRLNLSHDYLVQLCSSLTSWCGLERLWLDNLLCTDHSGSPCLIVADLQKNKTLEQLKLGTLPIRSMLLPCEGESKLRSLILTKLELSHDSIVKLFKSLAYLVGLQYVHLTKLSCNDHSSSHCLPVIDLQKNHELRWLTLEEMTVEGLLSPTQINQFHRLSEDYNLSRVSMPAGSWGMFIEGLASSDKTFKVTLESCNIGSDTRDLISSCPEFNIVRNDDELVIFKKQI